MDERRREQLIQAALSQSGKAFFERGQRYFEDGRVMAVEWDEAAHELVGQVIGSGGRIYHQHITISRGSPPDIDGECSCPVQFDCKHVVATLLAWLEEPAGFDGTAAPAQPSGARELARWRERLERRLARRVGTGRAPAQGEEVLLYRLSQHRSNGERELRVDAFRSRQLLRGGWGKPYPFNLGEITDSFYLPPAWVAADDVAIARLAMAGVRYGRAITIDGEDGLVLLKRLLRTGRCFWGAFDREPLAFAPPRPVHFGWDTTGDDGRRLTMRLEPGGADWVALPTDPPWYVDPDSAACGPIDQPLDPELFRALCELPEIPPESVEEFSRYLLPYVPADLSVPLPQELQVRQVRSRPQPVLILWGMTQRHGVSHFARLRLDYDGCELAPFLLDDSERVLVAHRGEEWDIQRDLDTEYAAFDTLHGLGLIPVMTRFAPPDPEQLDLFFWAEDRTASALAWREFLDHLPELEAQGWRVRRESSFLLRFDSAPELDAVLEQRGSDWFDLGLSFELGGRRIELLPLIGRWLRGGGAAGETLLLEAEAGHWVEVPGDVIRGVVETLVELYDAPLDDGHLRLPRQHAARLGELQERLGDGALQWLGGEEVRRLGDKLRLFQGIGVIAPPQGLSATLRGYQREGLNWLQFLREYGFGGILADDMGLGKTLQTLTHLLVEKRAGRLTDPALVVAPTSLLGNWRREAGLFTPDLRALVLHGPDRKEWFGRMAQFDLVITSYPLLARDGELADHPFHCLVLDEAQTIKNPRAKTAQAARAIRATHRLCLTGTPLENHLGELWALFDFLMPGFLGDERRFNKLYRNPIEKEGDGERQRALAARVAPFMLRRTKQAVASELPPKSEIVRSVELEHDQRRLYETIRAAMADKVRQLLAEKGLKRSHIELLDALLKLRQVCCDPRLVKLESARKVKHSAKLTLLMEMLPELLEEGRRVLVFSQFATMLGHIESELQAQGIAYAKLTGRTRDRDTVIASFQDGDVPVFLISLKAGGTGLNLTQADTVIHYDPWWNPAVENQATDRAHRIGQDKPVFVYKLIAEGTVEEKILALQQRKQTLADAVYRRSGEQATLDISADEMLALFEPE